MRARGKRGRKRHYEKFLMYICGVLLSAPLSPAVFRFFLSFSAPDKQAHVRRIADPMQASLSLLGDILPRVAAKKVWGVLPHEIAIGNNGKPYFPAYPHYYFNISHDGSCVVCAVDNAPVGIDILHNRPLHTGVIHRYFSKEEQTAVFAAKNPTEMFNKVWTIRESAVKMRSIGIQHLGDPVTCYTKTMQFADYTVSVAYYK